MIKNAIITISIGKENNKILSLSQPFFEMYAKNCNVDFIIINKASINAHNNHPHYEKFQLLDYLNDYDRILFLDSDIIVQEHTPNLFEIVPETHIGAVYDS